jgi:type I restriction enzyme, S subunit
MDRRRAHSGERWPTVPLKRVADVNPLLGSQPSDSQEVPFFPMDSIGEYGGLRFEHSRPFGSVRAGYTTFRSGDVLIAKITPCFENGKGAEVPELPAGIAAATTEVHILRPGPRLDRRFMFYWSISDAFRGPAESTMQGAGGQKRISTEYVEAAPIPFPSRDEQRRVGNFLDRETSHIDALIDKKERLIRLLDEKRAALITQAVTKGLNPEAPMKDSGVEWIGEIPEYWEVTRLKFLLSQFVDCLHSTPTYSDEGHYPAIRTADVDLGSLDVAGARRVDRAEYDVRVGRLTPEAEDILYSREGERFGHAAIVPPGVELCLSQRMVHLRARREVAPGFLMWALNSRGSYQQAALDTLGATSPHVNLQTIRNVVLAVPPLPEQEVLRSKLEGLLNALGKTVTVAKSSITLLRERRAALITAAVTGQLDIPEDLS